MLALAWPLVLANFTQQAINATDVLLMGRLGPRPLAATTLALNLTYTLNMFMFGLMSAAAPMIATALGQRANAVRDVRRTFRAGLWLLAFALPLYWLLLWNIGAIMHGFGQDARLAATGQQFMRAYMWCTAPWLLFQLMRNLLSAMEQPRVILWLSLAGIPLNALLSYALIFGAGGFPELGVIGAGIGSTATWTLLTAALALYIHRQKQVRRFHLFGRFWRFDQERTWKMARLGLPMGASWMLEMGVFALAAFLMGWIGEDAVAAHAVALQIAALTFMIPLGLGQAATVRIGRALGAGDNAGITRAGWTAWLLGVLFMGVMALLIWLMPRPLITLFLIDSPANAAVISLAVTFLTVAAAFQLVDGAQVIGAGMLRGLHDTRWPLIFALVGYWGVGLGVGAWLAFGLAWQGLGLWVGLAAGLAVVAVLMLLRWIRRDALGLTPTV
ncbi:MAG: MATE family efflux transporter [Sphingomicrobium sp.]